MPAPIASHETDPPLPCLEQRLAALEQQYPSAGSAAAAPRPHRVWSPAAVAAAEAVLAAEAVQAAANRAAQRWSPRATAAAEAVAAAELAERRAADEQLRDWSPFVEPPQHGGPFGDRFCTDPIHGCYVEECFVDKERVRHREVDIVHRRRVVEEDLPFIAWLAGISKSTVAAQGDVIRNRAWRELYELRQVEAHQWTVGAQ